MPDARSDIIDIGAGSGRDACWFATQGHHVTAVEPVDEMSEQATNLAGAEHVEWINDHLPTLTKLQGRAFDFVLLSGVWHHLTDAARPIAFARLASLLRPEGRLAISLRIGPDTDGKTNVAIDTDHTIEQGRRAGLILLGRATNASNNPKNIALGVTWDWLIFERKDTS